MRDDIATNGLLCIRTEHGSSIDLRNNLIGNDDRDSKFICKPLQIPQKLRQMHLSSTKLSSPAEISAVERGERIDDQQREARFGHHCCSLNEQVVLVVDIVGARVGDIVQDFVYVQAVPLRDGV